MKTVFEKETQIQTEAVLRKALAHERVLSRRHRLWFILSPRLPPRHRCFASPPQAGQASSLPPSEQSVSVTNLLWLLSPLFCLRAFPLSAQGKTECPCQEPGTLSSCGVVTTALFLRFCPVAIQTPLLLDANC